MTQGAKIGDAGSTVAEAVRLLRYHRRLTTRDLSARMTEAGRPILPSGIVKLEQKQRRIDVDDLIALASILEVPVSMLLSGVAVVVGTAQAGAEEYDLEERVSRLEQVASEFTGQAF